MSAVATPTSVDTLDTIVRMGKMIETLTDLADKGKDYYYTEFLPAVGSDDKYYQESLFTDRPEDMDRLSDYRRRLVLWLDQVRAVTVDFKGAPDPDNAVYGSYYPLQGHIDIFQVPTRIGEFAILAHETAHHVGNFIWHESPSREIVTEMTAYLVLSALGLDCHTFSLCYMNWWVIAARAAENCERSIPGCHPDFAVADVFQNMAARIDGVVLKIVNAVTTYEGWGTGGL